MEAEDNVSQSDNIKKLLQLAEESRSNLKLKDDVEGSFLRNMAQGRHHRMGGGGGWHGGGRVTWTENYSWCNGIF